MATWRARSAAAGAEVKTVLQAALFDKVDGSFIVGADELLLSAALLLIAAGFWQIWRPGAYLVPGLVLLWIGLPVRAPFIRRPPATSEKKSERRAG